MIKRHKFLLLSIVLHSLLLVPMFFGGASKTCDKKGKGKSSKVVDDGRIVERFVEIQMVSPDTFLTEEEQELKKEEEAVAKLDEGCKTYFGGIGITSSDRKKGHVISSVYRGYPAKRAGLKPGDHIIRPANIYDIKGKIGEKIEIVFIRDGITKHIFITRGKICTVRKKQRIGYGTTDGFRGHK